MRSTSPTRTADIPAPDQSEADEASPTWSPDGERIAFVSDRSNREAHQNEIWVVDADGGEPVRITTNAVWDLEPDWRGAG